MAINLVHRPDLDNRIEKLAARLGLKGRGRKTAIIEQALAFLEERVERTHPGQEGVSTSLDRYIKSGHLLRQRQPHPPRRHLHAHSDLQQTPPNRLGLRPRPARPLQPQAPQAQYQRVRQPRKIQPQLIRPQRLRAHPIGEQTQLFLDAVLHLAAGAIQFLVQLARRPFVRAQRRHHVARILLRVAPRIARSGVSTSFRYTLWVVASRLRNRNVRLRESCEWPPSQPTREFIAVAAFGRQLRESDALRSPTPRQSSNLGIRFLVDAFARPQHLVAT